MDGWMDGWRGSLAGGVCALPRWTKDAAGKEEQVCRNIAALNWKGVENGQVVLDELIRTVAHEYLHMLGEPVSCWLVASGLDKFPSLENNFTMGWRLTCVL